jgi:transposase, IS30 family
MKHLTKEQRYTIAEMNQQGFSQKDIAKVIDKNESTVSRELARNCDKRNGEYRCELAQQKYETRQKEKPKRVVFTAEIEAYVRDKLAQKLSPEQIVGEARKQGITCVSAEYIYQVIWKDKRNGGELYKNLRTQGKRYRKRGSAKDKRGIIKDRVDIDQRPKEVELKERIGDLEIDTIIGQNHQGAIVTINDRATGMLKMKKLDGKNAEELAKAVIEILQEWKPFLHTITADNGKEFAEHKMISEALDLDFYFAHPYHSWERGANENLNGLIRQYIPKKTDFSTITDEYVQFVENELNNRPRKRFGYESPIHMFNLKKIAFAA